MSIVDSKFRMLYAKLENDPSSLTEEETIDLFVCSAQLIGIGIRELEAILSDDMPRQPVYRGGQPDDAYIVTGVALGFTEEELKGIVPLAPMPLEEIGNSRRRRKIKRLSEDGGNAAG